MRSLLLSSILTLIAASAHAGPAVEPLPNHPGNVVLAGTDLSVRLPDVGETKDQPERVWKATDYEGKTVKEGATKDGVARLGQLPVGYYEVRCPGSPAPVTAAVLAPLKVRPTVDSPICLDVATAWFYKKEQLPAVANLCSLAGVSRVRDRLNWAVLESEAGKFAGPGIYDETAAAQFAAGLSVLQVNHVTPKWAGNNPKRFPSDLRDIHRFYRVMAERWRGSVAAFEPWNEADIDMFGGHTGSEMASLQKAAYLGLKAGNPAVIACMNVFALSRDEPLDDLTANEPAPYFDTFNLHHYASLDKFPATYASFRRAAGGKPMWTSEFQIPVHWSGDPVAQELSVENLRLQAERLTMSYAAGLNEGPVAMFYFVMPHYTEGETQYGLLHKDLTPRASFVALAAVGRLLAEAKPLGRLKPATPAVTGYLFNASPDGVPSVVLVAWTADQTRDLNLGVKPVSLFDHLGRSLPIDDTTVHLKRQPIYAVLPRDAASRFSFTPFKPVDAPANITPSPIVLQAVIRRDDVHLNDSAFKISSQKPAAVSMFAYNFADAPARGTLTVAGPSAWKFEAPKTLELAAGERKQIDFKIDCNGETPEHMSTLKLTADMGAHGKSVLSFRVLPVPQIVSAARIVPLKAATDVTRFKPEALPGTKLDMQATASGVSVDATLPAGDRWIYPRLDLKPNERAPVGTKSIRVRFKSIEGKAEFRVLFIKSNGAVYVGSSEFQPNAGEALELFFHVASAGFGKGFSPPDPDGKLDPSDITAIRIGCNASDARVRYEFDDVNWVK